jgi:hypothetical protein
MVRFAHVLHISDDLVDDDTRSVVTTAHLPPPGPRFRRRRYRTTGSSHTCVCTHY